MTSNKWHSILSKKSAQKFLSSVQPGDIVQIVWTGKQRDRMTDPWNCFCRNATIVWPLRNTIHWSIDEKYRWQCDADVYRVHSEDITYHARTRIHCGKGDKVLVELQSMKARIL